ncbi:MAG: efflux RND transporter periplasmic adaptor subunit [Oligoflexia bacterium]|nr:efflux RND transporter periplasmic adaptor subunit [Oligoflexia bacterium]
MKPRAILPLALLLLATLGAGWWLLRDADPELSWRIETVTRQDVQATVSATGSLEAVTTVEVGTQVSGTVQDVLVDFNDPVQAGQVIAHIDTSLLQADVASAGATLTLRRAELNQATLNQTRVMTLHEQGAASQQELEDARTAQAVATAQATGARVSLDRARRDLGYATITSPISGTVIERAVEQGQTVNAGLTAPKLFVIAGDLSHMQILVNVDESDIGRVAPGQAVDFTVQAYDGQHFTGVVRQVRLQSVVEENVVTYSVVVDVDNAQGKLLPGMTAMVDVVVEQARDADCVPNAALRYRPDAELVEPGAGDEEDGRGKGSHHRGRLWIATDSGKLRPLPVTTGLTNGTCTVVSGAGVQADLQVVAGAIQTATKSHNPFRQKSQRHRPGGF